MRAPILRFALMLSCLASGNAMAGMSPQFTKEASSETWARECVVQLAARPPGTSLTRAREAFARRAAGAGLEFVASLAGTSAAGLAAGGATLRETGRAPRHDDPFDLDPERILLLRARDASALREGVATLRDDPTIEWLEPNLLREPCEFPADLSLPDDPLLRDTRQWGLWNAGAAGVYRGLAGADIGARAAWAISCGSNDLRLAFADTGMDPNHPDLVRTLPDGASRLYAAANVSTGATSEWTDWNGHGTAVAGVMAALTHDGPHFDSLGAAGVCGGDGRGNAGCRLIPIKITTGATGSSSSFEIARAIVHATNHGARAMNLSFAGGGGSRVERMALYYAITRGCVVVAASGNRGHLAPPAVLYPAAFASYGLCVAVGASDAGDRRAMFSSYGPGLDLVAPGLDVWTTALTYPSAYGARYPGYLAASGTSFAAPHVTGTIGLMAAVRPDLADTDFQRLLRATARDIGAPGRDAETAWGRLDAAAAVRAVSGAPGNAPGLWHDERPATVRSTGRFALLQTVADSFGTFDRGATWRGRRAELFEATLVLTLPDSFTDSALVWPRVGGTMALRGDFNLAHYAPWAEVADRSGRSVTLRGYLYRVPMPVNSGPDPEPDSADFWLPLPPDQARIGFTVFGAVDRTPRVAELPGYVAATELRAWPNPSGAAVRISGPPGRRVVLFDLAGRVVREATLGTPRGGFTWDLRDRVGRRVAPGVYLVREEAGSGPALRIAILE